MRSRSPIHVAGGLGRFLLGRLVKCTRPTGREQLGVSVVLKTGTPLGYTLAVPRKIQHGQSRTLALPKRRPLEVKIFSRAIERLTLSRRLREVCGLGALGAGSRSGMESPTFPGVECSKHGVGCIAYTLPCPAASIAISCQTRCGLAAQQRPLSPQTPTKWWSPPPGTLPFRIPGEPASPSVCPWHDNIRGWTASLLAGTKHDFMASGQLGKRGQSSVSGGMPKTPLLC